MDSKIGTGWSFPPHFNSFDGSVDMTTGEAEIQGSLAVIFSTRLEERLFRPDFGCSMEDYQFKPMDTASIIRMRRMIDQAVRRYEPRIDVREIGIDGSESQNGVLRVILRYGIKESAGDETYTFQYENSI